MRSFLCLATATLTLFIGLTGCAKEKAAAPFVAGTTPALLQTSLHGTAEGMRTWYETSNQIDAANPGFESLTHVPFDQLQCKNCHVDPNNCTECHVTRGDKPRDGKCLACHSRQEAEIEAGLSDVHRDHGMQCADCHRSNDAHGDGTRYSSMFQDRAIKPRCEDCHPADSLLARNPENTYHLEHVQSNRIVDCTGCHVQSVVTCYNCHFDEETTGGRGRAAERITGWKFLVRSSENGRVVPGNIQTLVYHDSLAFVALAPYFGHTISRNAITACADCHGNEYVTEYEQNHRITIATWDPFQNRLVVNKKGKGIIPVPEDWKTSLLFDFETYAPGTQNWQVARPDTVGKQILFAMPLPVLPHRF